MKKLILTMSCAIACAQNPALTPQHAFAATTDGEDDFKKAQAAYAHQQMSNAVELVNRAIQADATKAAYYNLRAKAYYGSRQYQTAIMDSTKAVTLDPKSADAYYYLACSYIQLRQTKEALEALDKAIALDPKQPDHYVLRSQAHEDLGNGALGVADADQALKLAPRNVIAWYRKGEGLSMQKKYALAVDAYTHGLAIQQPAYLYFLRGKAYSNLNQWQKSIADMTQCLAKNPTYPDAHRYRGYAYSQIKDFAHAKTDYEQSTAKNANDADFFADRARLHGHSGDAKSVLSDLDAMLKVDPNNMDAQHGHAIAAYQAGEYQICINDCTRFISSSANNAEWYCMRGKCYAHMGSYNSAIDDFSKAIQSSPRYKEAYSLRAQVYRKLGKEALAIKDQNGANLSLKRHNLVTGLPHVSHRLGSNLERVLRYPSFSQSRNSIMNPKSIIEAGADLTEALVPGATDQAKQVALKLLDSTGLSLTKNTTEAGVSELTAARGVPDVAQPGSGAMVAFTGDHEITGEMVHYARLLSSAEDPDAVIANLVERYGRPVELPEPAGYSAAPELARGLGSTSWDKVVAALARQGIKVDKV